LCGYAKGIPMEKITTFVIPKLQRMISEKAIPRRVPTHKFMCGIKQ